jgi:hypothetical protein
VKRGTKTNVTGSRSDVFGNSIRVDIVTRRRWTGVDNWYHLNPVPEADIKGQATAFIGQKFYLA